MTRKFQLRHIGVFLAILLVPILALVRATEFYPWEYLASGAVLLSVLAFTFVGIDKRKATRAQWRIPENHLHLLELLGGWPGSYLAQRLYWHKVSKMSYQVTFWIIVAIFQYVALDYLLDWRLTTFIAGFLRHEQGG